MTTTDHTRMRSRPIGELFAEFASETTTLLGQEMELARAEVTEQVSRAGRAAGMLGAAAILALCGLGALTAAAVAGLAEAFDTWLAALIVGGAILLVAAIVALIGRARLKRVAPPVPERAMTEVRRDMEAVQEGVQAGRHANGGGVSGA